MTLLFTQCKKDNLDNTDSDAKKVRVSCTIPLNEGGKSDFTNLMTDGSVNWSDGWERVYVAIHGTSPQIIELKSWADGNPSRLEFEGEAAKDLITDGTEYDIWYFGHSQQLDEPNVELTDGVLTGSIANQSGRLEDLGYCHIAKTTVTAGTVNEEVVLNLNGTLKHQIAIALLDLNGVSELYGDAIKGTEYTLTYNSDNGKYELVVTEDSDARISVESASGISYVVLLPNEEDESEIKCKKNDQTYAYTFHNGIKSNKVYFKTGTDGTTVEALTWSEYEEEIPSINGHEYVDLGLPSGLKWATCNVGANNPEDYGNYYAWGETATKSEYTADNSLTDGLNISGLQSHGIIDGDHNLTPSHDAATANWGGTWRMPTLAEQQELSNNCTWEWTTLNGVNGCKVTGPNGNHIFLPAAGYRYGSSLGYVRSHGIYWSSTPREGNIYNAWYLYFINANPNHSMLDYYRRYGQSVRPVSE